MSSQAVEDTAYGWDEKKALSAVSMKHCAQVASKSTERMTLDSLSMRVHDVSDVMRCHTM